MSATTIGDCISKFRYDRSIMVIPGMVIVLSFLSTSVGIHTATRKCRIHIFGAYSIHRQFGLHSNQSFTKTTNIGVNHGF
ncbi:MAG: hypothetical protein OMM_07685 [Candidatus Magnetoglobus multicellularis str. Araruama]|uniref:Uncharacterized protein n=1 Tax=Candidatus Magnetoglobus multicellularis str. Araruama TaxID=890399 RepID=A0A1V1PBK1_9BACT|nr:MAG: hypothetical protein OMM_07685 [Candidatus Magnetoglobus multicellularis str. Araruama]